MVLLSCTMSPSIAFRNPSDITSSVLYSTSYTTGFEAMQKEFHIKSEAIPTLGVTTYLLGLAVGSPFLAPISETYGRRPVYIIAMFFFIIFVIPCAKATSLAEIIVVRFFGAVAGSAMIANAPGSVGDIIGDEYRALAFSIWSIGPLNGPGQYFISVTVPRPLLTLSSSWTCHRWLRHAIRGLALD
jgi:MFS family permease